MTARITIDYSWSAKQLQNRLVMLFQGRFVKWEGQRFSFTFLQVCLCVCLCVGSISIPVKAGVSYRPHLTICVAFQCMRGSEVLFVPDTPAEGWTGEQVLRISEHGALYILSHLDYPLVNHTCNVNTSAMNKLN